MLYLSEVIKKLKSVVTLVLVDYLHLLFFHGATGHVDLYGKTLLLLHRQLLQRVGLTRRRRQIVGEGARCAAGADGVRVSLLDEQNFIAAQLFGPTHAFAYL